jgi:hypothetical protein
MALEEVSPSELDHELSAIVLEVECGVLVIIHGDLKGCASLWIDLKFCGGEYLIRALPGKTRWSTWSAVGVWVLDLELLADLTQTVREVNFS